MHALLALVLDGVASIMLRRSLDASSTLYLMIQVGAEPTDTFQI